MPIGYLDNQGNWQVLKHYTDPIPGERTQKVYIDRLGNEQEDAEMDNMFRERMEAVSNMAKKPVDLTLTMGQGSATIAALITFAAKSLETNNESAYVNAVDALLAVLTRVKEKSNHDS